MEDRLDEIKSITDEFNEIKKTTDDKLAEVLKSTDGLKSTQAGFYHQFGELDKRLVQTDEMMLALEEKTKKGFEKMKSDFDKVKNGPKKVNQTGEQPEISAS